MKIANYCKEELLKNMSGVEVYMTRTSSAACPYPSMRSPIAGGCIAARADAAAKAGSEDICQFSS